MATATSVLLLLLITTTMLILTDGFCGVWMKTGLLSSNCSGFFGLSYGGETQILKCNTSSTVIYHHPLIVTHGNCTDYLLDSSPCLEESKTSVCRGQGRDLYLLVLAPILFVLLVMCTLMIIYLSFLKNVGALGPDQSFTSIRRVKLNTPSSQQEYSWKLVLLIGLCLAKPTSQTCMEPLYHVSNGEQTSWEYSLAPGEEACFSHGRVTVESSQSDFGTTLLYSTGGWTHHTWSARGCGNGLCGNEADCSAWGSNGRVVEGGHRIYLKHCIPHPRSWLACVVTWGCWLATKEVYWKELNHQVHSIDRSDRFINYTIHGLNDCVVWHKDSAKVEISNHHLVINQDESWICPRVSTFSNPLVGSVGDIQMDFEGNVTFNFDSFKCEINQLESNGRCEVAKPGISTLPTNCLKLPTELAMGVIALVEGQLVVYEEVRTAFTIRCPLSEAVVESNHDCFQKFVEVHGIKGEGGFSILTFRASSKFSNSTWLVHSNCTSEVIEVVCNDRAHSISVDVVENRSCSYSGMVASDLRKVRKPVEWSWDSADHQSVLTHSSTISVLSVVLVIISVLALRILCR